MCVHMRVRQGQSICLHSRHRKMPTEQRAVHRGSKKTPGRSRGWPASAAALSGLPQLSSATLASDLPDLSPNVRTDMCVKITARRPQHVCGVLLTGRPPPHHWPRSKPCVSATVSLRESAQPNQMQYLPWDFFLSSIRFAEKNITKIK